MLPLKSSSNKKLITRFFAPLLNSDDVLATLRTHTILAPKQYYFDFTASGLAYRAINKRIESILPYYANTHSHISSNAALMSALYEEAKERICSALGLSEDFVLISGGSGASFGIKKFQEIMGIYVPPCSLLHLRPLLENAELKRFVDKNAKDSKKNTESHTFSALPSLAMLKAYDLHTNKLQLPHIIMSGFEHHSNEISYKEGLCHTHKIAFNEQGLPDTRDLAQILHNLKGKKIIASLSAASNVTGILAPIESYAKLLRDYGGIIALDMASLSAYANVESAHFDVAFFAPHKLLGGVGACGILALRKSLLDNTLPPSFCGGGVIEYANDYTHSFIDDVAMREEAGTPPILGLLYGALAYQLRNEIGFDVIKRREKILTEVFLHELTKIPAVSVYGDVSLERLGIVSFNIGSISPLDLCALLSRKYGIHTRAGCSCAGPYGHYLIPEGSFAKKPMWLRVSIHYTHSVADIEYLIASIKECVRILRG
ncbi:MAG: aminotransferase class V-fold PLP-dependent enzyme [Helicobacter sp.]|uniref:aminotransferase class V-fold PLP-dependent enzyme n=1 Tax=Helicobacter sp. TaxID=218 RepID=UPI0025C6C61C|nr:aminotransferase class V-fold PLP-dependent enzyme [Helicobacter sp.]MCH5313426.1 aminotransferase class V-fold PLP-dependent enzyme [Helicobacter sp.]